MCRKHNLPPPQFYKWQKQFFENGAKAFEIAPVKPKIASWQAKITQSEEKLPRTNEVVRELMETHLQLKKSLRER